MSLLSQFYPSGGGGAGSFTVGLATGFTEQIPVDLMLIGGGGGGGSVQNTPFPWAATDMVGINSLRALGGGGGAGRLLVFTNCLVNFNEVYPITVGAGGAAGARGGASRFGVIKAGGGGAGGGTTPDGTIVPADYDGLFGGGAGGLGILPDASNVSTSSPSIGSTAVGGLNGNAQYSADIYAVSRPFTSVEISSTGLYKQAINSLTNPYSPFLSSPNPLGGPAGATSYIQSMIGGSGHGHVYYNQDPGPIYSPYPSEIRYDNIIPILSSRHNITPIISSAGISYGTGTFESYNRSSPNAPAFIYPSNTGIFHAADPLGGKTLSGKEDLIAGQYTVPSPSGTDGPTSGWNYYGNPMFLAVGASYAQVYFTGGNFSVPAYPATSLPVASVPTVTPPVSPAFKTMPAQTGKLIQYTVVPSLAGTPGNGQGGGGGLRQGPALLSGTISSPYVLSRPTPGSAAPSLNITATGPYALTIPASTAPMASGGAGGSGSVWVIYPSDYAAATVTGNTPVPSPPAVRVYRWDGAGTIKFNA